MTENGFTGVLQARLSHNPGSSSFAQLALLYLGQRKVQEAIDLCVRGLKAHPRYATGHLVLGKCYEEAGRNIEALLEYRKALRALPDSLLLKELLSALEQKFSARAGETVPVMHEPAADAPETPGRNEQTPEGSPGIVSPTMAEIYAVQGRFGEAIAIYRALSVQKPAEAARFERRIIELEEQRQQSGGQVNAG